MDGCICPLPSRLHCDWNGHQYYHIIFKGVKVASEVIPSLKLFPLDTRGFKFMIKGLNCRSLKQDLKFDYNYSLIKFGICISWGQFRWPLIVLQEKGTELKLTIEKCMITAFSMREVVWRCVELEEVGRVTSTELMEQTNLGQLSGKEKWHRK